MYYRNGRSVASGSSQSVITSVCFPRGGDASARATLKFAPREIRQRKFLIIVARRILLPATRQDDTSPPLWLYYVPFPPPPPASIFQHRATRTGRADGAGQKRSRQLLPANIRAAQDIGGGGGGGGGGGVGERKKWGLGGTVVERTFGAPLM
jgi:hypothetical protein